VGTRTGNLIIILIALVPLSLLARVKNWGTRKPQPRSVFIQGFDAAGRPIKTTVSFPIRVGRDPSQPVVSAIGLGIQVNWLDRDVPLEFLLMSPGYESIGVALSDRSPRQINVGLRPAAPGDGSDFSAN